MSIQIYYVSGMTCGSCVAKVKEALESVEGVENAQITLENEQVAIQSENIISLQTANSQLAKAGRYAISEEKKEKEQIPFPSIKPLVSKQTKLPSKSISTYKPLFLIVGFIAGVCLLAQYPFSNFSGMLWMRHFMAGFFIVFAFFKLLNLSGFANSYRMYDIVAAKWKGWGFTYPFVELALGICYLINIYPFFTNLATVIILGISSIGVIKSNLDKKEIKCACLGDVFNLPMSTVTIIEDLAMVAMAAIMLF